MRSKRFLKTTIVCASLLSLAAGSVLAADTVKIGVAGPMTGPFEVLGQQLRTGAEDFAKNDGNVKLEIEDAECDETGGKNAAIAMVRGGVGIATGFLCTEALSAAIPVLADANIPIITTGVRTDRLLPRNSDLPPVFRMLARSGGEERAVSSLLVGEWRDTLFAIVDDGTIHARELAESLRLAAENAGLKPAYVDTFRPQMDNQIGLAGRLKKAGVTHVFAAGDRSDIAILARDAKKLGIDLTIAGGESLLSRDQEVPLPAGVLAVAPQHLVAQESAEVMDKTLETSGFWSVQYAAAQIAADALRIAGEKHAAVRDVLLSNSFDTKIGPVKFAEDGTNVNANYGLYRYDGIKFKLVKLADPSVLHPQ
jgi:branched-chain amino acid transport system substrate-binding protein